MVAESDHRDLFRVWGFFSSVVFPSLSTLLFTLIICLPSSGMVPVSQVLVGVNALLQIISLHSDLAVNVTFSD